MKAIILAAGYATRLYPLTKDTPKALLPVAGRTILDRLLDGMRAIPEIDHIHLVTNHRFAPAFEEWRQTAQVHCPITVHDDGTTSNEDRLGAVGDIAFVLERAGIDDDLFVAASDNLFTFPLSDFAADFRRHGRDCFSVRRLTMWIRCGAMPWLRWMGRTACFRWWKSHRSRRATLVSAPFISTGGIRLRCFRP